MTDSIQLTAPPVLSTPETHILEDPTPLSTAQASPRLSDEELWNVYELERTAKEIRDGGYKRVALQFPDGMLKDAPRISQALEKEVWKLPAAVRKEEESASLETSFNELQVNAEQGTKEDGTNGRTAERVRLYILADTSYGSCCVDEIAAEHVNADVVVHYGRSCLSPTARLPVIYVFTTHPLSLEDVVQTFETTFPAKDEKVVLMADITYNNHIPSLLSALSSKGYENLLIPEVIHDPSSTIPNRKLEEGTDLKEYSLFHISNPPTALLLTLSSRVKEMFIYPTAPSSPPTASPRKAITTNTTMSLRRRYALLTSLSTCPVFGILINTLSVKNYLNTATSLKTLVSSAGKKSYTFVVGKINAAKIANFSEIGGWVVVGCWESSLVENNGEFFRPVITPFELGLVLVGDGRRLWDGGWRGDFGGVEELVESGDVGRKGEEKEDVKEEDSGEVKGKHVDIEEDSEEESEAPEFDLRTGRYVSHSRPMRASIPAASSNSGGEFGNTTAASNVLTRRAKGDLATVNGAVSPGAEYLRTQRTWTGLGSDFHEVEAPQTIEEGRSGVARGYTVGEGEERR
ncbi:related to diphthamide synthesis protein DPH2 [Phialocephala subalpina]|uniref:2-(3-amino-3-carboxypropyl)histidine synthase subunit 2 n=1 Tax=Phialocephala subalpina TaxID=576137 RepID=A0A1L7XNL4_9HELO|nr:related to diphthamide synthesis protein DPH2 [Phialocephala subalpina]